MEPNFGIISSAFPEILIPKHTSVLDILIGKAGDSDENIFLNCLSTGQKYSRRYVITQGKRFGEALREPCFQLQRGDVIAVCLPNVSEYLSILLGCFHSNIVPVLFSPELTTHEIQHLATRLDVKALICMPGRSVELETLLDGASNQRVLITIGRADTDEPACFNYFDLIHRHDVDKISEKTQEQFTSTDVALMLLSSGTTGIPKGVEFTHDSLVNTIITMSGGLNIVFGHEVFLTTSPVCHVVGLFLGLLVPFYARCRTTTMHKFTPDLLLKGLLEHKPTCLGVVSSLLSMIATNPCFKREDFSAVRTIFYGGAVGGTGMIESVRKKIGEDVFQQEIYGMTEFVSAGIVPRCLKDVAAGTGSIGLPYPNTLMKIVDTKTGKALGPNQTGEICFKGKQCMQGYYKNPEETDKTIDAEGWVHSGDLGYYRQPNNLIYVCGRIKDLIKVNAYQVSPDEIEDVLKRMDNVGIVSVFGIPHPKYGEVPRACIVPMNVRITEDDVHNFIKDKLAHYKQLKGGIKFISEMPFSSNGKVLRRHLRELYSV